ncbi:MAG: hypothetical protein AAF649_08540, partial [Verrucomicrobiota bacterium]
MRPIPPGYGKGSPKPALKRPAGMSRPAMAKPAAVGQPAAAAPAQAAATAQPAAQTSGTSEFLLQFKSNLLPFLIQRIDPQLLNPGQEEALKQTIEQLIDEKLAVDKIPIGRQLRDKLIYDVVNEMIGFGPLE